MLPALAFAACFLRSNAGACLAAPVPEPTLPTSARCKTALATCCLHGCGKQRNKHARSLNISLTSWSVLCSALTGSGLQVPVLMLQAKALRELAQRIELCLAEDSGAGMYVSAWLVQVIWSSGHMATVEQTTSPGSGRTRPSALGTRPCSRPAQERQATPRRSHYQSSKRECSYQLDQR